MFLSLEASSRDQFSGGIHIHYIRAEHDWSPGQLKMEGLMKICGCQLDYILC